MTTSSPVRIYITGVGKRDKALYAFGGSVKADALASDHSYLSPLPVFWGFEDQELAKISRCWGEKRPFIFMDHAYFKRGYEHGNVRVCVSHFHQTKLLDVPDDRSLLAKKRLQPWQKDGRHVVIIDPSERICRLLGVKSARDWVREKEHEVRKYTSRPILVKRKGGSILDAIRGAHAVVSLSSVAEVESVVHGVPVFVTKDSPAFPVGLTDLSKLDSPIYPDREMWLRTLSYSQFHLDELANGTAKRILREIYGLSDLLGPEE